MTITEDLQLQQQGALLGRYDLIRGNGDGTFSSGLPLAGVALAAGTYRYALPCSGNEEVVVTLKPTTVTGSCTARVFTPLASDSITINASIPATPITLTAGTQTETTVAATGEHLKILELVVPASGALVFAIAEVRTYNLASSGGGGGGGGAVTVADGADSAQGFVADAAVTGDTAGTISAKLRGLLKTVADVYNGTLHTLGVTAGPGESHIGEVGSPIATPSANFTRPADTSAYVSGDLVGNSTTAGSVVPLSWTTAARVSAGSFMVRRARLQKSGTTVTNANFRLHLYGSDPSASTGIANGDNGAWSTKIAGYLGSVDLDMSGSTGRAFTDAASVTGVPAVGSDINVKLGSGQTIYGLLEARAAYTPLSAEVFTVVVELLQN